MVSSLIFRAAGFQEVIEQLREINGRLGNLEVLLEFLLTPPDLSKYKKGKNVDDLPRKSVKKTSDPVDL